MHYDLQEHILVPTDFGEAAWAAFRRACDLGRPLAARLTLLHVKPQPRPSPACLGAIGLLHSVLYSPPVKGGAMPTLWSLVSADDPARRQLDEIANSDWSLGVEVETLLTAGDVADEILRVAGERHVTLTVMGARGHRERRADRDSVTPRVLREAAGPVMLVPRRPPRPVTAPSGAV